MTATGEKKIFDFAKDPSIVKQVADLIQQFRTRYGKNPVAVHINCDYSELFAREVAKAWNIDLPEGRAQTVHASWDGVPINFVFIPEKLRNVLAHCSICTVQGDAQHENISL